MTGPRPSITVVGASAAGLFLAARAAERGVPVSVHERRRACEQPPRTLIVTARVRDMLGPRLDGAVMNSVGRYELIADGRRADIVLRSPDLVIERSALLGALTADAEAAGADVQFGARFVSVEPSNGHLVVRFDRNGSGVASRTTRTLVGADGVHSAVARRTGWVAQPTVPLVQALVPMPDDLPPDTSRVWFRPHDTPYFYWLIPHGPDRGVLGLIGDEPRTARRRLDAFLDELRLPALGYQAARIPAYAGWVRPRRRLGSGEVFLVGDAAGQVKVSTVGGVQTGFRGAQAVADAVLEGDRRALRSLRWELDRHRLVRRAIHRFGIDDYRRLLELLHDGTRSVLGTHTRDESNRLLWRLAIRQPRLLALALRGVLTANVPDQSSAGTRKSNHTRSAPDATSQPISM